jgi:hypothetical protein
MNFKFFVTVLSVIATETAEITRFLMDKLVNILTVKSSNLLKMSDLQKPTHQILVS